MLFYLKSLHLCTLRIRKCLKNKSEEKRVRHIGMKHRLYIFNNCSISGRWGKKKIKGYIMKNGSI